MIKYNALDTPAPRGNVDGAYYIGSPIEMRAIYKSMFRASKEGKTNLCPTHCGMPKFNRKREAYALSVNGEGYFSVLSSDTMMALIVSGYAVN